MSSTIVWSILGEPRATCIGAIMGRPLADPPDRSVFEMGRALDMTAGLVPDERSRTAASPGRVNGDSPLAWGGDAVSLLSLAWTRRPECTWSSISWVAPRIWAATAASDSDSSKEARCLGW